LPGFIVSCASFSFLPFSFLPDWANYTPFDSSGSSEVFDSSFSIQELSIATTAQSPLYLEGEKLYGNAGVWYDIKTSCRCTTETTFVGTDYYTSTNAASIYSNEMVRSKAVLCKRCEVKHSIPSPSLDEASNAALQFSFHALSSLFSVNSFFASLSSALIF
jgi:hypothetical protein